MDERQSPDPDLRHTAGQTLGLATEVPEVPAPIFRQNWEDLSMQQTMVPWRSSYNSNQVGMWPPNNTLSGEPDDDVIWEGTLQIEWSCIPKWQPLAASGKC